MSQTLDFDVEISTEIAYCVFRAQLTATKTRLAVKFATSDERIVVHAFDPDSTDVKRVVADVLGLRPRRLKERVKEIALTDEDALYDFKQDIRDCLMTTMTYETLMKKINEVTHYQELRIADIRCVTVTDSLTDMTRCVPVQIFNQAIKKANIGGYRNIGTGSEYYHAFSQTGPRPSKVLIERLNTRDTQTSLIRHQKTDIPYSRATQMWREDLYIPSINDRILSPKPYENSDERAKRLSRLEKILTIQRYFRAWKIRKNLKVLSREYQLREQKAQEALETEDKEDETRRRRALISKVFPKSQVDFGMLYTMAERWKKSETQRIGSLYCGPSKIAELTLLLDKEIEIFKAIDKIQQEVKKENNRIKDATYLTKLGAPLRWYSDYKCLPVEMDSIENQRARHLDTIYQNILATNVNENERLSALLDLKLLLKNDDCELAIELNRLVERACDLLSRGFSDKRIAALMKRIRATALYHFKQKECYKGLAQHQDKQREEFMQRNLFVCIRCQQMKTVDQFSLNARAKQVNVCKACKWVDKTLEPWAELSPYRFILQQIRKNERLNNSPCSIAYILQDRDIHHLVNQIWHSHSAVSENNDIYNLRLCRWKRDSDWSPWNCILLTLEETKSHLKVEQLEDVYEKEFIDHVYNKHALARKHFKDLLKIEHKFKSLYKVCSFESNLDNKGFVDYRKLFPAKTNKRVFF